MPELPEVQTVVTTLRPRVLAKVIVGVRLARLDILTPNSVDLVGLLTRRVVRAIDRRGKRIIFTLDDDNRFYIHLGMTGQLTVARPADLVRPHTHLVIEIEDRGSRMKNGGKKSRAGPRPLSIPDALSSSFEIRFRDPRRFGGVWWVGRDAPDAGMGPEPLGLRPSQLAARLSRTTRAIKSALLDQTVIAGLGNIYVDESLFAAGIHPLAPANTLSGEQIARLNRAIKGTLRRAIRHRGSTLRDYTDADGGAGGFQKLHGVYDRAGQECRRCKSVIDRIVLGGRSTHFCAKCQSPSDPPSPRTKGRE